jgi:hypothetical protein
MMEGITHRSNDPFAGVHSAVPDDGWLRTGATVTIQMDAADRTTLERVTSGKNLGVGGEGSLQIIQEVEVTLELVVRVEVGQVRQRSSNTRLHLLASGY